VAKKSPKKEKIFALLAEDQTCERCNKPIARHTMTPLGAVMCTDLPANAGLTRWDQHRFTTRAGKPYLSIMEQIGALAGVIEERGLPDAYLPALDRIDDLQWWLRAHMPEGTIPERTKPGAQELYP
jgi:hypothetical protein